MQTFFIFVVWDLKVKSFETIIEYLVVQYLYTDLHSTFKQSSN